MTKHPQRFPTLPAAHRAWVDTRPAVEPHQRPSTARTTRWAVTPLPTPHGEAIAVRLEGGTLWVGLRVRGQAALRWRPAEQVLTEAQASRWVRTGFRS